ncbi:MAG: hypothetical protein AAFO83_00895 [Cyanobacteria bacterium J06607_13]
MTILIKITAILATTYFAVLFIAKYQPWLSTRSTHSESAARVESAVDTQPVERAVHTVKAVVIDSRLLDELGLRKLRELAVAYNKKLDAGNPNRIKGAARLKRDDALTLLRPRYEAIAHFVCMA